MNAMRRLLDLPPGAPIYRLYTAAWLIFLTLGVGFYLQNHIYFRIAKISDLAELVLVVVSPALSEHVLTEGGSKIQKTLDVVQNNAYIKSITLTAPNGLTWQSQSPSPSQNPPSLLSAPAGFNTWLQTQLTDIQKPLPLLGRTEGTLRLHFATETLANEFWTVILRVLSFAMLLASLGFYLGRRLLRRVLAQLFTSSQQAERTLNALSEGVITCNAQFKLVSMNPAAERFLGLNAQENPQLVGQDIRQLLPNLFLVHEVNTTWISRAYQFNRTDGGQVMLETGLFNVQDLDAYSACKVLTLRDVSQAHALFLAQHSELQEHKSALANMRKVAHSLPLSTLTSPVHTGGAGADELNYLTAWVLAMVAERESSRLELEYQKYAIDQHAIVAIFDTQGVLSYANDRYCAISGFERAELMGQKQRGMGASNHTGRFYAQMLQANAQGQVWHGELQSQNKQGQNFWVNATAVPLFNEFLVQDRIMLIGTDITQDHQNKAQLSEQLSLMEVLLEALPIAVYFKDRLGCYVHVNSAFETLFGVSRAELIGHTAFDIVTPSFALFSNDKDRALLAEGGVQTFVTQYTHPQTGGESDFGYTKALTTDDQGRITGIVGVILDVTERNLVQRQLQEATRLAQAANRAKSNFLANMSHEIRTPMNGVIGMVELALGLALDPIQQDYLNLAKSSALALMVVVNDILDISKIEANRLDIEAVAFALPDMLLHSFKPMQVLASKKGLAFAIELSPDLPVHVTGDATRLRQVLLNLCDNAIKFTPQGSVTVQVWGAPVVDGAFELTVAVIDTGIGIAAEHQSTVFGLFNQADASTTRKYGGSGLGLTISMRLAALMGGRITLESTPGQGSTFTLCLRLAVPQLQLGLQALESSSPPAEAQKPLVPSAFKVLLVEDNLVNQILCSTILKKIGHSVVLANHGQEALDLFAQQHWDVILMDMQMPVMDGLEATRAIRALELPGQHTPIVAMTANAMLTDRQRCLDAGMDDYLSKPFRFAELEAILENAVRASLAR